MNPDQMLQAAANVPPQMRKNALPDAWQQMMEANEHTKMSEDEQQLQQEAHEALPAEDSPQQFQQFPQEDGLTEFTGDPSGQAPQMPGGPQSMNVGQLMSAEQLAGLVNVIVPALAVLGFRYLAKKEIDPNALRMTAEEKKLLAGPLQNYLNSVNFSVDSPLNALLLTAACIYGPKVIEVYNAKPLEAPKRAAGRRAAPAPAQERPQTLEGQATGSRGRELTRRPGETRGRKPAAQAGILLNQ